MIQVIVEFEPMSRAVTIEARSVALRAAQSGLGIARNAAAEVQASAV